MSILTQVRFTELCYQAEQILRNCGAGAPQSTDHVWPDYGMYRLGDNDYLAVGLTWRDSENRLRSAKIQDGVVTDHYIIFGEGQEYRSAQINPNTFEYIAVYRDESNGLEPKIEPITGAVLQPNFYTAYHPMPQSMTDSLTSINFPYIDSIYCWANKPYGTCVEFVAQRNYAVRENPASWYHLPYKVAYNNGNSIRPFHGGYALFSANAGFKSGWADDIWMCTDWNAIAELLAQVEYATGRVLCTGLGLGIIPLLVAEKDLVTEVVVIEHDQTIIDLFMQQGFNLDKIKVICANADEYSDLIPFDTILLDHYNDFGETPILNIKLFSESIRTRTTSPNAIVVPYRWIEFLFVYGTSTTKWGAALGLPKMTLIQEQRYQFAYTTAQDAIPKIVASLESINAKKTISNSTTN